MSEINVCMMFYFFHSLKGVREDHVSKWTWQQSVFTYKWLKLKIYVRVRIVFSPLSQDWVQWQAVLKTSSAYKCYFKTECGYSRILIGKCFDMTHSVCLSEHLYLFLKSISKYCVDYSFKVNWILNLNWCL